MKKIMLFITIILLIACTKDTSAVESLKNKYPKTVKEVVEQLPLNVQKELVVPTKLPFKAKNVSVEVQKNKENGDINFTSIKYLNGELEVIMYVTTYHNKNATFTGDQQHLKTTKLKNGTKMIIQSDDDNTKTIRWKENGLYHSISILFSSETGKQYAIKDLVKTANSMSK